MSTPLAFLLDPAVKHERVRATVSRLWQGRERADYGLCLGLRRLYRDQVHRGKGRGRFVDWVEQRFGIPAKLAGLFSWLGSRLEELPLCLSAMESGELTYTKLREFVKQATPENEDRWIEYARTHTNREIEMVVRRKEREDGTETVKVVSTLTPAERQAERKAREVLTRATGKPVRPEKLHAAMAEAIASGGLFDQTAVKDQGKSKKASAYVSFQPCPICLDAFVPVPEGLLRVPAAEWIKAIREGAEVFDLTGHFLCDCEGEKHRKDRCPEWKPPKAPPPKNRTIPASILRQIEARDGFVCRTPDCGCEVPLENSHLTPFCDGTPALLEYIRKHCATCNDMIESGALRVVGCAPYERYYDADGKFLGYGYYRRNSHVGTEAFDDRPGQKAGREPPGSGVTGSAGN